METKKKTTMEPYDLWGDDIQRKKKAHPSAKRSKKDPLPHPGQSYNPDPDDHRRLLKKIARKELEYQKEKQSILASTTVKVDRRELIKDAEEELLAGIKHLIPQKNNSKSRNEKTTYKNDGSDDSNTEDAYSDYDEKDFKAMAKDKRVKEKRKSKKQRLGHMKDLLQRKAAKLRKLSNKRSAQFDGLKKMTKAIDKKIKEDELKRRNKKNKRVKSERLGQKFEPSDPIYCLTDELPDHLRQIKCPMGALVRERLESFQSRLLVEPTQRQIRNRKYKKQEFERKLAIEQEA